MTDREEKRKGFGVSAARLCLAAAVLGLIGCSAGQQGQLEETAQNTGNAPQRSTREETVSQTVAEETESEFETQVTERTLDFPFGEDMGEETENWSLVLHTEENGRGNVTHSLRLYDDMANLMQELDCPLDSERLTVRFDQLADFENRWYDQYADVEIFASDAAKTGAEGFLYIWSGSESAFEEEPIKIPWYEEAGDGYYVVRRVEDKRESKEIYYINGETREPVRMRSWELTWENDESRAARLRIEDCLEQTALYDGAVEQYAPTYLAHSDYYETLFRQDMYRLTDYRPEDKITVSNLLLADDSEWKTTDEPIQEYESREEFLAFCGFAGQKPYYQYYDALGRLELELYLDETAQRGCGFLYAYYRNFKLERVAECQGFLFEGIEQRTWEDDTYSRLIYDGGDAAAGENVTRITSADTADGRPLSYEVRCVTDTVQSLWAEGITSESADESLLSIDWLYRGDGSLYCREYSHNPIIFGTTAQVRRTYYDELERSVYRYEYITHGSLNSYYLYEGDAAGPKYGLTFDHDVSAPAVLAQFFRYE